MAGGLATRCTACATVFRVVPDQLRVSDGWVRCGRCAEVFNAAEHLLDVDSGAPRRLFDAGPAPLPPRAPERLYDPQRDDAAAHVGQRQHANPEEQTDAPLRAPDASQQQAYPQGPDDLPYPAANDATEPWFDSDHGNGHDNDGENGHDHGNDNDDDVDENGHGNDNDDDDENAVHDAQQARGETDEPADDIGARFDAQAADSVSLTSDAAGMADLRATPWGADPASARDKTPSFLRRAESAQRWRQPGVRATLWAVTLLGGLGLAGQIVFTYRDLAAARFTVLRPALEQVCSWLACSVGEAHAIDSLVVESSGLVRVEKSSIYRLSVSLRNRAAIAVAMPAIEIALTDAQGKLLARRVLRATELGAGQPALAAGRDLALQATLQVATDPVAGYTIELFYP